MTRGRYDPEKNRSSLTSTNPIQKDLKGLVIEACAEQPPETN